MIQVLYFQRAKRLLKEDGPSFMYYSGEKAWTMSGYPGRSKAPYSVSPSGRKIINGRNQERL